jgi:hypothetical protein
VGVLRASTVSPRLKKATSNGFHIPVVGKFVMTARDTSLSRRPPFNCRSQPPGSSAPGHLGDIRLYVVNGTHWRQIRCAIPHFAHASPFGTVPQIDRSGQTGWCQSHPAEAGHLQLRRAPSSVEELAAKCPSPLAWPPGSGRFFTPDVTAAPAGSGRQCQHGGATT